MKTNIIIEGIAKESEKAVCLNAFVYYSSNNAPKLRQVWMPKSVVEVTSDKVAAVEDWFLAKIGEQNAFHGYTMKFDTYMNN